LKLEAKAPFQRLLVLALALIGIGAALQLASANGADSPSSLREHADALRAENDTLGRQTEAAWLSAVSLDTRLRHSRAALVALQARTEEIARQRSEAQFDLRLARRALVVSQERLAARLRALYQDGQADPVAVLLESESIGDAIERLDRLDRVAVQDHRYVEAAKAARARLIRVTRALAEREAEARRAQDAAAATAAALEAARREQTELLARLHAARSENSTRASQLDARAGKLAAQLAAVPPQPASIPSASAARGRTLTVTATGYSIRGRTSTGVSAAWGIVAVDPSVIPLGTRMTIPGYGDGVAADTGGGVAGARIDLWFPTVAEALAWGTRSVTITLR
jgi:peptidoglycan DL-endopeptidase CwlO